MLQRRAPLCLALLAAFTVAREGSPPTTLKANVRPSTSAEFGFGPYYSSTDDNPMGLSANIDDVAVVVAR